MEPLDGGDTGGHGTVFLVFLRQLLRLVLLFCYRLGGHLMQLVIDRPIAKSNLAKTDLLFNATCHRPTYC